MSEDQAPAPKPPASIGEVLLGWMVLVILVVVAVFIFRGCSRIFSSGETASGRLARQQADQAVMEQNWIERGKAAIQAKLKDGDSAIFRGTFYSNSGGSPVSCGEVNSKNSLGAYAGFQRYVATHDPKLSYLEEEVADGFGAVWSKLCIR